MTIEPIRDSRPIDDAEWRRIREKAEAVADDPYFGADQRIMAVLLLRVMAQSDREANHRHIENPF